MTKTEHTPYRRSHTASGRKAEGSPSLGPLLLLWKPYFVALVIMGTDTAGFLCPHSLIMGTLWWDPHWSPVSTSHGVGEECPIHRGCW